jgi:hypothetical protein
MARIDALEGGEDPKQLLAQIAVREGFRIRLWHAVLR